MIKTKFKLFEISVLAEEIHGLQDRNTGDKVQLGLLDEKISLVQKYWLTDLGKKAKAIVDEVEPLRNELITKYGETGEDGSIGVSAFLGKKDTEGNLIGKEPNPKWGGFNQEYSELMDQEKEIEHQEFLLGDFSEVKSQNRYVTFIEKVLKP
jgi:hypothetical protein